LVYSGFKGNKTTILDVNQAKHGFLTRSGDSKLILIFSFYMRGTNIDSHDALSNFATTLWGNQMSSYMENHSIPTGPANSTN
jgi:hypothetical protein